jgi:hypothetical protein
MAAEKTFLRFSWLPSKLYLKNISSSVCNPPNRMKKDTKLKITLKNQRRISGLFLVLNPSLRFVRCWPRDQQPLIQYAQNATSSLRAPWELPFPICRDFFCWKPIKNSSQIAKPWAILNRQQNMQDGAVLHWWIFLDSTVYSWVQHRTINAALGWDFIANHNIGWVWRRIPKWNSSTFL